MSILLLAEHGGTDLKAATLNAVTAATQIGGDIAILIAGSGCQGAADAAAKLPGIAKVLLADNPAYDHALAENVAPLIVGLASGCSHVVAPATTAGKNIMPRVSALLDVQQISDIAEVVSADTFVRPIYAGNAMATVQSSDPIKVITVRGAAFDPAPTDGGSAAIEAIDGPGDAGLSRFIGQELSKSERPELTSDIRFASDPHQ